VTKELLITGFEPFGGENINPSWEAVSLLPEIIGSWHLTKLRIPVEYTNAAALVIQKSQKLRPDAILCIGQAGGRSGVTPEAIAINLRDSAAPDNAGLLQANTPIISEGPAAYFTTVPVREMVAAIKSKGIPASRSLSAGAYVCNDVLYTLLHHFQGTKTQIGFIHVPYLPEQAKEGIPALELAQIVTALTAAIEVM